MKNSQSALRRVALGGCASIATPMLFDVPSRAEQQVIDFFVNSSPSNDITSPLYNTGAPNNNFQTGWCPSYRGPGQGHPNSTIVLPGGFNTTSSGLGAIGGGEGPSGRRANLSERRRLAIVRGMGRTAGAGDDAFQ